MRVWRKGQGRGGDVWRHGTKWIRKEESGATEKMGCGRREEKDGERERSEKKNPGKQVGWTWRDVFTRRRQQEQQMMRCRWDREEGGGRRVWRREKR